ncbi:MAG: 50S ribosomal protein L23 [Nitriliruptoraceae bacterium]
MNDPRDIILRPVISEKSYGLLDENKYTFLVDPRANKTQIKQAIQAIFDVDVVSVNTMNRAGKRKRRGWVIGKRPDVKRAIVTVAPGDEIELFDAGL